MKSNNFELEQNPKIIFSNGKFVIGLKGDHERWYQSIDGKETYDGDSLYGKVGNSNFELIDGRDLTEVGLFHLYENTFRKCNVNGNEGFMIAYSKVRELAGKSPNVSGREMWLNLLTTDLNTQKFVRHNFDSYILNDFLTMPLLPEINIDDITQELSVTARIAEPHSMSFEKKQREDIRNYSKKLKQFEITLEKRVGKDLDPVIVRNHISGIAPHYGCDHTYNPLFPEGRRDVCAVRHMAENGRDYGSDHLFLVWQPQEGEMKLEQVCKSDKYLNINNIIDDGENIVLDFRDSKILRSKKTLGIQ